MQLAVIAPGKPKQTVSARAAIDTSTMDGNDGSHSAYDAVGPRDRGGGGRRG